MKAAVLTSYADPSVLHEADLEAPTPAAGQIRARVHAAGVNPIETVIRSGAFGGPTPAVHGAGGGNAE